MKISLGGAVLLLVSAAATSAAPAPAARNKDVRCLMLSNLYSKASSDVRGQTAAAQNRLFYLGRVSAKVPPAQLGAAMAAETRTIDPANTSAEMNACSATLRASASTIEAAGDKAIRSLAPAGAAPAAAPAAGPTPKP